MHVETHVDVQGTIGAAQSGPELHKTGLIRGIKFQILHERTMLAQVWDHVFYHSKNSPEKLFRQTVAYTAKI